MRDQHRVPSGVQARWSPIYRQDWDDTPERYVVAGLVEWSRSRRLARFDDPTLGFKAYAGIQHYDPACWNVPGDPRTRFFLSLFLANRTVTLRTFATLDEALAELARFHAALCHPSPDS